MSFKGRRAFTETYDAETGFDRYAASFSNEHAKLSSITMRTMLKLSKAMKGHAVVDFGCGDGRLKWLFEKRHPSKVIGVDLSEAMLQKASEANCYDLLVHHDMRTYIDLDMKEPVFALLTHVLYYIQDRDLQQFLDHLRDSCQVAYLLVEWQERRKGLTLEEGGETFHIQTYPHSEKRLIAYIEQAGFTLEEHEVELGSGLPTHVMLFRS